MDVAHSKYAQHAAHQILSHSSTLGLPPATATKMLENATVAISAKPPTAAKENPAVEYSNAANIACSKEPVQHQATHVVSLCCQLQFAPASR